MPAKMTTAAARAAAAARASRPDGESQLVRYDFTFPKVVQSTGFEFTVDIIRDHLEQWCSKWVFQV